ncbi:MAG TPA: hypothetical protein VGM44_04180, partial [Polyangiaceae bacterium]
MKLRVSLGASALCVLVLASGVARAQGGDKPKPTNEAGPAAAETAKPAAEDEANAAPAATKP